MIEEILNILLGRKYYAVVLNTKGTMDAWISSYIFEKKEHAENYIQKSVETGASFQVRSIISFRSKDTFHSPAEYINK